MVPGLFLYGTGTVLFIIMGVRMDNCSFFLH